MSTPETDHKSMKITPETVDPRYSNEDYKFPDTLRVLEVIDVPLYPSICNITTLKQLNLNYSEFTDSPEKVLTLLKNNCWLEKVCLTFGFGSSPSTTIEYPQTPSDPFTLDCLSVFWVHGPNAADVMRTIDLVSCISLSEHTKMFASSDKGEIGLNDVLSRVKHVVTPFTRLLVDYSGGSDKDYLFLKGPKGELHICPPSRSEMTSVLMEESDLLSFKTIESLDLEIERGDWDLSDYPSLNPSLFPALRTLTIASDHHLETILSKFFSSPPLSLIKIKIESCHATQHFWETTLRNFASEHGYEYELPSRVQEGSLESELQKSVVSTTLVRSGGARQQKRVQRPWWRWRRITLANVMIALILFYVLYFFRDNLLTFTDISTTAGRFDVDF